MELRSGLASSKELIASIGEFRHTYPSPHRELERLAALLGDDTWLTKTEINGTVIKIEGQSSDASAVMQRLLDDSAYTRVEAPTAFRKMGSSGVERFALSLTLAPVGGEE